jgi:tetratricopeptide (TPR) repeat protein
MPSSKIDSSGNLSEDTLPTHPGPSTSDTTQPVPAILPEKKIRRRTVVWLGILFVLILGAVGGWLGYQSGINSRLQNQVGQVAVEAATQFQLGLQDQAKGNLAIAQQRFEYVISLDPNFPGAQEKLAEVMLARQISLIPTDVPTPTLTPTPDTRGEQDMFAQILQNIKDNKWSPAIDTINALRAKNLGYRSVDVDGLYYIALIGRGIQKITNGDLEGGIYDMTIAERFGPLDSKAIAYRTWARLYLNGASFWGVDWEKVVNYFADIYQAVPNLHDSSMLTASERYRIALYKYGDQIAATGDYCKALQYYQQSLAIGLDPTAEPKATAAYHNCHPDTPVPPARPTSTPTPTPTGTGTATPTLPGVTPSDTPPAPTPTNTPPAPATSTPTTAPPTKTPQPPTNTPGLPTHTPQPPTKTSQPPTATPKVGKTP